MRNRWTWKDNVYLILHNAALLDPNATSLLRSRASTVTPTQIQAEARGFASIQKLANEIQDQLVDAPIMYTAAEKWAVDHIQEQAVRLTRMVGLPS